MKTKLLWMKQLPSQTILFRQMEMDSYELGTIEIGTGDCLHIPLSLNDIHNIMAAIEREIISGMPILPD